MHLTAAQVTAFKNSQEWKAIQALIEKRFAALSLNIRKLEGVPCYRAQGGLDELEWAGKLPDTLIKTLEMEEKEKSHA